MNAVGNKSSNLENTILVESDLSTVPNFDIAVLPTPAELDEKEYEFSAKVGVKELQKSYFIILRMSIFILL